MADATAAAVATAAVHVVAVLRLQAAAVLSLQAVAVAALLVPAVQSLQAAAHRLAEFGLPIQFSEQLSTQLTKISSHRKPIRTT
jgi:hypothetical protein